MISKSYVGLFGGPLTEAELKEFAAWWLETFDRLEQVYPGPQAGTSTFTVHSSDDILWDEHLQFRVVSGDDFAWVYITKGRRVVETSGLPYADNLLPLNVLVELPGLEEVIDHLNEKRLDQLEAEGLL